MSSPPDTDWRYGVYLAPLPPLLALFATGGMRAYISLSTADSLTDSEVLMAIGLSVLGAFASLLAVLFALVVAVSAFVDAGVIAERGWWSPNRWAVGAVGLLHVAATEILPLSLLSTPVLLYYCYERRRRPP